MIAPRQTTAPADTPVSVADAKGNQRVGHSSEDAVFEALIAAAVSHLDGYSGVLGRCMVTSSWEQKFSGWPVDGCLRLPLPDVDPDSVEITYMDQDDVERTLPAGQYEMIEDARSSAVVFRTAFTSPSLVSDRVAPVTVAFDAGYGDPEDVPAALKQAILLIVGDLYENRENTVVGDVRVTEMPIAVNRLIAPFRRVGL